MTAHNGTWDGMNVLGRITGSLREYDALRTGVMNFRRHRAQLFDALLGIQTTCDELVRPNGDDTLFADSTQYEATDYPLLWRYMSRLRLKPHDVVYEIGCGMGRTVCCFARQPIAKCVGIEVSPPLVEAAQRNTRTLRGRLAPIEIRLEDAALSDYTEGTIFWFNSPFGEATMAVALDQIERSLQVRPRQIRIVYILPRHENVLADRPWLECVRRERSPFYHTFPVSYWRSRNGAFPRSKRSESPRRLADSALMA